MYDATVKEKIIFNYRIDNKDVSPFTENIYNELDISYGNINEKTVRIVNHFFRFLNSIGFELDDVLQAIDAVVEAYDMIDNEEETEDNKMTNPFMDKGNSVEEDKDIDSFNQFEAEVITSSKFRNYLYNLFKEDHE